MSFAARQRRRPRCNVCLYSVVGYDHMGVTLVGDKSVITCGAAVRSRLQTSFTKLF